MKDLTSIQLKLQEALKRQSNLNIELNIPCSGKEFREVAWVVLDYVNQNGDVTNDDPLHSWVEEYQFYLNQSL